MSKPIAYRRIDLLDKIGQLKIILLANLDVIASVLNGFRVE